MKSKPDGKYKCKVSSAITCIPKNRHPMQKPHNKNHRDYGIYGHTLKNFISDTLKKLGL